MSRIEHVHKQGLLIKTGHYNYPITFIDVYSNILDEANQAARAAEMQRAQYTTNFAYLPSADLMNQSQRQKISIMCRRHRW
jgi:hypothetical protein